MIKLLRKSNGFTLIELVMVMVIISVISVVIGRVLLQDAKTFEAANNISETDWQGFIALERMVDDVHTLRSPNDFSTISSNQLIFTDVNSNTVSYSLSSGALIRSGQTLASGITSLAIGYLDENGATTATASAVRYISISLSATNGNLTSNYATLVGVRGAP